MLSTLRCLILFLRCSLQWLWALPLTLCGLPLWCCAFTLQRFKGKNNHFSDVEYKEYAILFVAYGACIAWFLKRHPWGDMQAIAIGCCIFARDAQAMQRCGAHERAHVRQALRWGVLFPLAYAACSGWAWYCGRCPYADNYFERQANSALD